MINPTLHGYSIHFDELVPEKTLSMRKATYEAITGEKVVDPTLAVRKEPAANVKPRSAKAAKQGTSDGGEVQS